MNLPTEKVSPEDGRRQTYHEEDGNIIINIYQDVEPHMEYAAACRRVDQENRGRFGKRPDFHRKMSVPFNVIMGVAQRLGIPAGEVLSSEHSARIMDELKRPEFAAFRTTIDKNI